ncbi:hypothetical protein VP01_32g12 [Puccinia sorghi]|uniref:Uncharacterized protein n=1 Tax=Puccinia sorghi TaxID=27349 RepID=A0A0L6UXE6_9BASI|nr:hypothetical protein VP01_32g12 [Puccinia sorghi]
MSAGSKRMFIKDRKWKGGSTWSTEGIPRLLRKAPQPIVRTLIIPDCFKGGLHDISYVDSHHPVKTSSSRVTIFWNKYFTKTQTRKKPQRWHKSSLMQMPTPPRSNHEIIHPLMTGKNRADAGDNIPRSSTQKEKDVQEDQSSAAKLPNQDGKGGVSQQDSEMEAGQERIGVEAGPRPNGAETVIREREHEAPLDYIAMEQPKPISTVAAKQLEEKLKPDGHSSHQEEKGDVNLQEAGSEEEHGAAAPAYHVPESAPDTVVQSTEVGRDRPISTTEPKLPGEDLNNVAWISPTQGNEKDVVPQSVNRDKIEHPPPNSVTQDTLQSEGGSAASPRQIDGSNPSSTPHHASPSVLDENTSPKNQDDNPGYATKDLHSGQTDTNLLLKAPTSSQQNSPLVANLEELPLNSLHHTLIKSKPNLNHIFALAISNLNMEDSRPLLSPPEEFHLNQAELGVLRHSLPQAADFQDGLGHSAKSQVSFPDPISSPPSPQTSESQIPAPEDHGASPSGTETHSIGTNKAPVERKNIVEHFPLTFTDNLDGEAHSFPTSQHGTTSFFSCPSLKLAKTHSTYFADEMASNHQTKGSDGSHQGRENLIGSLDVPSQSAQPNELLLNPKEKRHESMLDPKATQFPHKNPSENSASEAGISSTFGKGFLNYASRPGFLYQCANQNIRDHSHMAWTWVIPILNNSLLVVFRNLMFHLPLIFYGNPSENVLSGHNRGRAHRHDRPARTFSRLRPSGTQANLFDMAKSLSQEAEEKNADPQKPPDIDPALDESNDELSKNSGSQTPLDPHGKVLTKYPETVKPRPSPIVTNLPIDLKDLPGNFHGTLEETDSSLPGNRIPHSMKEEDEWMDLLGPPQGLQPIHITHKPPIFGNKLGTNAHIPYIKAKNLTLNLDGF